MSTENIDELSKRTLGNYINGAQSDRYLKGHEQGSDSTLAAHHPIIKDELDKKNAKSMVKTNRRSVGIFKAVNKLVKKTQNESTILELIDSIESGSTIDSHNLFDELMQTKLMDAVDEYRNEITNSLMEEKND